MIASNIAQVIEFSNKEDVLSFLNFFKKINYGAMCDGCDIRHYSQLVTFTTLDTCEMNVIFDRYYCHECYKMLLSRDDA